jgi:hypothetical protein
VCRETLPRRRCLLPNDLTILKRRPWLLSKWLVQSRTSGSNVLTTPAAL